MEKVGVREFRASFSHYISRIREGEKFIVNGVVLSGYSQVGDAGAKLYNDLESLPEIPQEKLLDVFSSLLGILKK